MLIIAYALCALFWFGGGRPWVVIHDPDIARKLCLRFNTRLGFDDLNVLPHKEMLREGTGIFSTNDMALWRVARKAYDSALLLPTSLSQYTPIMDACTQRLITKLDKFASNGQTIDIWRDLGDMTLEIVGECSYGIDFHSVDDGRECSKEEQTLGQELVDACRTTFQLWSIAHASRYVTVQLMFPLMSPIIRLVANVFPDAGQKKTLMNHHRMRNISHSLIEEWEAGQKNSPATRTSDAAIKRQPDNQTVTAAAEEKAGVVKVSKTNISQISDRSFLSTLLAARGEEGSVAAGKVEGRTMDDNDISEQSLVFILTGYETTANTLAFAIYLLAVNPSAEARLLEEVDKFGRTRPIVTMADLEQFPYVDAIIKETLRLHSPAPFITRVATEALEVNGKRIPSGTMMVFPSHVFHNSAQYWPRPTEFLPERFLPDGADSLGPTTANAHIPFGMGARMCPGYKFAQQEAKIAMVRLFQNFTFTLAPGMPRNPRTVTGLTTSPADGVPVRVTSRK